MPADDPKELIRLLLDRAGVPASEGDLERVNAIVSLTPPRPAPRHEVEPQLVHHPGDWSR